MSFTNAILASENAQTIQSNLLIQLLSFLAFFLQIVLVQVLQKATCSGIRTWILEEVWQDIICWWLWCFDIFTSSHSLLVLVDLLVNMV